MLHTNCKYLFLSDIKFNCKDEDVKTKTLFWKQLILAYYLVESEYSIMQWFWIVVKLYH